MDEQAIWTQRRMAKAARELHEYSDALVNLLEGKPILKEDSAAGDEARAAYENACKWRARMESGE